MNINPPGPNGRDPMKYQMNPRITQAINIATEYGIINDNRVPTPASSSYSFIYARMIGKYVNSGEIIFVDESPILYKN